MLLQHVSDIECHVYWDKVGPLLSEVGCLQEAEQGEYLAHDHRVGNVAAGEIKGRSYKGVKG